EVADRPKPLPGEPVYPPVTKGSIKDSLNLKRESDLQTSRERLELYEKLTGELTIVLQQRDRFTSVEALKKRYPDFALWQVLPAAEQNELLTDDFNASAWARNLAGLPIPASPLENALEGSVASRPQRKRGRPTEIPDECKRRALAARGGKARAQILYGTKY